jgi:hypothetical protein
VDDLIEGIALVIRHGASRNQTFNLTYGQARSIGELLAIVQESFPDVKVEYTERDKRTPRRGTLNIQRARSVLGYAPEIPIEAGFSKYIHWYRDLMRTDRLEMLGKRRLHEPVFAVDVGVGHEALRSDTLVPVNRDDRCPGARHSEWRQDTSRSPCGDPAPLRQ